MSTNKMRQAVDIYDDEDIWVNQRTGEIMYLSPEEASKRQKGEKEFFKLFREEFWKVAMTLKGNEHYVFYYIIRKMQKKDNLFKGLTEEIMKATGVSRSTVTRTIAKLKKADFLRHKMREEWMVNPYMVMYGRHEKQCKLYAIYAGIER